MNVLIRPMKPEELERVASLLWTTTLQSYRGLVEKSYLASATPERYETYMKGFTGKTLVAEASGLVVGFCCWDDLFTGITGWGQICAIGVLEEYRRDGIGTRLVEETLARMPRCNTILVTFWERMDTVQGLFSHCGFGPYGVPLTDPRDPHNTRKRMILQRRLPVVDFDLFLHELETDPMGEVCFSIEGDPVYTCCWLGGPCGSISDYWFGLVEDCSESYRYPTAQELVDAPVFRGKSLRQLWELVRIEDLDGVEPLTWAEVRTTPPAPQNGAP